MSLKEKLEKFSKTGNIAQIDWLNEWDEVEFDKSMLEGILDKWLK